MRHILQGLYVCSVESVVEKSNAKLLATSTLSNSLVPSSTRFTSFLTRFSQDNSESSSTQSEESRDYLPNETIVSKTIPAGLINSSSCASSFSPRILLSTTKASNARITITRMICTTSVADTFRPSVTAVDYNLVKEEDAKEQGLLDGVSWEEYKLNNQGTS